jgi:predicted anti-sigma-YlaC factor YlaD
MNQTHPPLEQLVEYLHGELAAPQDAAVHAHLAACSQCASAYEAEASLTEALRTHAKAAERDLPSGVVAAIRARVERPRQISAWENLRALLRPAVALPIAAALGIALYLGTSAWHNRPAGVTPINAAYYVNNHAALTAAAPFSEDAPIPAMLTSDDTSGDQQSVDETR